MRFLKYLLAALLVGAMTLPASSQVPPHWEGTGERTIYIENHLPTEWDTPLNAAINNWNQSPYINFVLLPPDDDCWDFDSQVAFCWESYVPIPSWIGLASLWTYPDGHLRYATLEANADKYWGPAKRRFVACHELGHALGLGESSQTSGQNCMMPRFSYVTVYPAKPTWPSYQAVIALYNHEG